MTIKDIKWRLEITLNGLFYVHMFSDAIYFSCEIVGKKPPRYGVHYFDKRTKSKFYTKEQFEEFLSNINFTPKGETNNG